MTAPPDGADAPDPLGDLSAYVALPRVSGLVLSPDGSRLVTQVAQLDPATGGSVRSLWEVDPAAGRAARRLTRSAEGESSPVFTPGGDLLFLSGRPRPPVAPDRTPSAPTPSAEDGEPAAASPAPAGREGDALWCLPAAGGEALCLASRPGGLLAPVVARESGSVALGSPTLPRAGDAADDASRRAARERTRTTGVLHASAQVRFWDHDLGPDRVRLVVTVGGVEGPPAGAPLRDLTGHVGAHLDDEAVWALTPDGATLVTDWAVPEAGGDVRACVVAIDVATGERRSLADDGAAGPAGTTVGPGARAGRPDRHGAHDHRHPLVSPDGSRVVVLRQRRPRPDQPEDSHLLVVDLASGQQRPLAPDWDRWPTPACWTPDATGLVVVADDGGRAPLFHVDLASSAVTRLTSDDGAYSDAVASPDGRWLYALRSAVDSPPAPVRLDLAAALRSAGAGVAPQPLPGPAQALGASVGAAQLPGSLTEVSATAADGAPLRAWLALPDDAGPDQPAPLLLWIHGGPLSSWNAWSWRWNPWLAVARGYAVLLPDPALSTGYGLDFVRRGWGAWGGAPYTDLMAITDAAVARPDVDASRTAAMGGSFGGYMANWIAGHTDRFAAIVTHASLWALDQFATTTDAPAYWARVMTPAAAQENSPHHWADRISTPVLVVHGDDDDRVPIGEGLRLWWDLCSRSATPGSGEHRYLHFPDEDHWVLGAGNAALWYECVFAFLAQHVLGQEWVEPEALG